MLLPVLVWYMKHCNYEKLKGKVTDRSLKSYAKDETPQDYSYPDDTRYYVRCEFSVKIGNRESACPEIWTSDESEAKYLLDNPDKVVDWLRSRIKADDEYINFVDKPIIEKDHQLPNYGGHPQLLAKTPQYIGRYS